MNVQETGYIKLHRSILSNPLANEDRPRTKLEAWLELLLAARYSEEPGTVMVGNKALVFHRGEIYASLRYLAESWKWSKNKVDGFLSYLEKEEMIRKRTDKGTGRTIITICNYAYYNPKGETEGQPTGRERDSTGTASGQHRDSEGTNKKKDKKGNKEKESNTPLNPPVGGGDVSFSKKCEYFIDLFNATKGNGTPTRYKLDAKAKRQLQARIKEGYTSDDFRKAILNCKADQFHIESGLKHLTPEFITRTDKLEKFLNSGEAKPKFHPGLPHGL